MNRLTIDQIAAQIRRLTEKLERLENHPWMHPKDVMSTFGISKATLYRWLSAGKLPKPVRVSGPIWRHGDLERWKALRKADERAGMDTVVRRPSVRSA